MDRYALLDLDVDDPGAPTPSQNTLTEAQTSPPGGERLRYTPTTRVLLEQPVGPEKPDQGWQPHELVFAVGDDPDGGTWVTITPLQHWLRARCCYDRELTGVEAILPPYMGAPEDESTWIVEDVVQSKVIFDLGQRGFVFLPEFQRFCQRAESGEGG